MTVPARRGAITDRNGVELAVSETGHDISRDAATWSRTRTQAADRARRRSWASPRTSCSEAGRAAPASSTSRARPPSRRATQSEAQDRRASTSLRRAARRYPQDWLASQVLGTRRAPTATGCRASSTSREPSCAATTASAASSATRSASRSARETTRRRTRPGPAADDRRRDPGAAEAVLAGRRAGLPAQGRDGDRHGPAHRRDPRAGQLAARRRQRPGGAPDYAHQNRAVRLDATSRARRSRRSPSPARSRTAGHAGDARSTCRRRSRSPTARSATPSRAAGRRSRRRRSSRSPATSARSRSACGSARDALRPVGARFGFGAPTGIDLPGEERGHRARRTTVLGLLDGQPADRPGRWR